MSMNLNTLAFLVRDDVTTCNVLFMNKNSSSQHYTFKITRELACNLGVHDEVLVHTCNGKKVARIVEIHDEPILDPEETNIEYCWVFQRVNDDALCELLDAEAIIEDKLRDRRKLSHRQQALAALGISNPQEFLKELTGPKE